jgi:uncharacterized phage-associated protein
MKANDVAKYYLEKDNSIDNKRLNKYLFLTQVVYLGKEERKLFGDEFISTSNGPVLKDILKDSSNIVDDKIKEFLDKIYDALKSAPDEELDSIVKEDPEWIKLSNSGSIMDLERNVSEYKVRYKGLLEAIY